MVLVTFLISVLQTTFDYQIQGYAGKCTVMPSPLACPTSEGASFDLSKITADTSGKLYNVGSAVFVSNLTLTTAMTTRLLCPAAFNVKAPATATSFYPGTYDFTTSCYIFSVNNSQLGTLVKRSVGNYWIYSIWNAILPIVLFLIFTLIVVYQYMGISVQTKFTKSKIM